MDALFFVVQGANPLRPFEQHHVFQIVCNAGCFGRIVLAAGPHGYLSIEPGFLMVLRQRNGQAVVESVDVDLHRIVRFRFVNQLETGANGQRTREDDPTR